ncbi:MAG: hypothetical protein WAK55_22775 [Xanthobacteraceae bacterium]
MTAQPGPVVDQLRMGRANSMTASVPQHATRPFSAKILVASFSTWSSCRALRGRHEATLAEFDKEEAEWRETAERQVLNLCEIENPLPTPEELDELEPDEAIRRIETVVENNAQL